MIGVVQDLIRRNATFEIVTLKRQHGVVLAAVEYRLPNGIAAIEWHVRQTQNDWRVDCRATEQGMFRHAQGVQ
jgi:hypothetical protein